MSHVASHLIDDAHLWWDKGSRPIVFVDAQPGQNLVGTYNPSTRSTGGSHTSYQSFAALQGNIPDGSTVFVRGGTYRTARVWWQGVFADKVVVKPFYGESVVVKPLDQNYTDANWPLFLLGGHNIRFELLEFDGEMSTNVVGDAQLNGGHNYHYAIGNVSTVSGAKDWEAYGLKIHGFAHAGIKGGNWRRLESNYIYNVGMARFDHAFYCWGDNIQIWWNWVCNISGYGMHIYGGDGNNTNVILFGNNVTNVGTCGDGDIAAILVQGDDAKVYHNMVHEAPNGYSIYGLNRDGHVLGNNVFSAITLYNIYIANPDSYGPNAVCTDNIFDPDAGGFGTNYINTAVFISSSANSFVDAAFVLNTPVIPADFAPAAAAPQIGTAAALADNYTVGLDPTYMAWPPRIARRQNLNAGAFV